MALSSVSLTAADPAAAPDLEIFDLAPTPLWLEDWSAVRDLLRTWKPRDGEALRQLFAADLERAKACASLMRVLRVNKATLDLHGAESEDQLTANVGRIFRDDMLPNLGEEVAQFFERGACVNTGVNYTLSGRRVDVIVKSRALPGHEGDWRRVLVSTEDVTALQNARRLLERSERYASGLFEHSPVSLWVEDFSRIKELLDDLRARGIADFRVFTEVHPEFVERCMSEIRVVDVNRHTVSLFGAKDKKDLLKRLNDIFRDEMRDSFAETLLDLWKGKLFQQREVVNYALDGGALYLHLQLSVLPGREEDWSQVQVALTDITARKKAESYLEFLGKNDTLTKLNNRSFYIDELSRIDRKGPFPLSALVVDVNGLKQANDQFGHAAGDDLLRRAGEVLNKAVQRPNVSARVGGDEFVVLMPGADESASEAMAAAILEFVRLNNQFYGGRILSFAVGGATSRPGDRAEDVVKRADHRMFEDKRRHYGERGPG